MTAAELRKVAAKLPVGQTVARLSLTGCQVRADPRPAEPAERQDGRSDNLAYNPQTVTAFFATYQIPPPRFEFHFHPSRKFRFDLAWPDYLCAVEVQGGIWTDGAHVRGAALLREFEKLRAACGLGWRVLPCTPDQLLTAEVARAVKTAIFWKNR